jgi:hypothetical protein
MYVHMNVGEFAKPCGKGVRFSRCDNELDATSVPFWVKLSAQLILSPHPSPHQPLHQTFFNHTYHLSDNGWLLLYHNLSSESH